MGVMLAYVDNLPLPIRKMGINPFPREVGNSVHADLMRLLSEKKIRPTLERLVSFEEIPAALELHEARNTLGRTAATIRKP